MTDMDSQQDKQASSPDDSWKWENQCAAGSDVGSTLSTSTVMTGGDYETAKNDSSAEPDHLKLAVIPKSLDKPYRETRSGRAERRIAPTPSASCIRELYYNQYPNWKDDGTRNFYLSRKAGKFLSFKEASDHISTGLSGAAETLRVKSSVKYKGTARSARSLYNNKRELVMTYGIEFNAKTESDSSTQASTVASGSQAIKQVNEEGDSETDAECMTDNDQYPRGYVNNPEDDPEDESEEDAQEASDGHF